MPSTADSVVVELIAKNDQFDAANKRSAAEFAQDMSVIESSATKAEDAHARVTKSSGNTRVALLELGHVARAAGSEIALGVPVSQIFAQEMGRLSLAAQFAGGSLATIGEVLQGPVGIGLAIATPLIATLISKHKEEAETLDSVYAKLVKHKEATELSSKAEEIWSHSLGGLLERSKKLNDEIVKRLTTATELREKTLAQARADTAAAFAAAARLEADPKSSTKDREAAQAAITRASIELHNREVEAAQRAGEELANLGTAAETFADKEIKAINDIIGIHPELAAKPVADSLFFAFNKLKKEVDAAASANVQFAGTIAPINKLNDELLHGTITVATYEQKVLALARSLHQVVEAAKGVETIRLIRPVEGPITSGFGLRTAPIAGASTFHKGIDIAAPLGTPVKAAAGGRVTIGNLPGLGNVVIIDHGGGTITEYGHLSSIGVTDKQIVSQGQVIGRVGSTGISTGPHLDFRVRVNNKFVDPSKVIQVPVDEFAIQQKSIEDQKRAAQEQQEATRLFNTELGKLQDKDLAAREKIAAGAEAEALAQLARIQQDHDTEAARIKSELAEGKYGEATSELANKRAEQLQAVNDQVKIDQEAAVRRKYSDELLKQQDAANQRATRYRIEDLTAAEALATNQATRRDIELQIIDIEEQEKLAHLEYLRALAVRNKEDPATIADLAAQIERVPQETANKRRQVLDQTLSPIEAWLKTVPGDARDVEEALQNIAVHGFDSIADSIAGVVTGTQSLGAAFNNISRQIVADLVTMIAKMLIFRAVSSLFPSLFGISSASTSIIPGDPVPGLFDFSNPFGTGATGANIAGGQPFLVGERGPELFIPAGSGTIVPNNQLSTSGWGAGYQTNVVNVYARDAVLTDTVKGWVREGMLAATSAGINGGAAKARGDLSRTALHRLR